MDLPADQREDQLMVMLKQSRRIDQICAANGLKNVRDSDACREQTRGIGCHLKFRHPATLHQHGGNSIETVQARLQIVSGQLPKLILRNGVRREAVSQYRKGSEGKSVGLDFCACGQFRLQARHNRIHSLQRENHVRVPIEEQIDLGRPPAGHRLHLAQARYAVDSLFDRFRDDHQHLIDGHNPVVYTDDDSREIRVGKYRDGNSKG
jgi:hypothetical protein